MTLAEDPSLSRSRPTVVTSCRDVQLRSDADKPHGNTRSPGKGERRAGQELAELGRFSCLWRINALACR